MQNVYLTLFSGVYNRLSYFQRRERTTSSPEIIWAVCWPGEQIRLEKPVCRPNIERSKQQNTYETWQLLLVSPRELSV